MGVFFHRCSSLEMLLLASLIVALVGRARTRESDKKADLTHLPTYEMDNEMPNNCGDVVGVSEALIFSHAYPYLQDLYERNTDCYITFKAATPGWKLRLVSRYFDVSRSRLNCRDVLLVYRSETRNSDFLVTNAATSDRGFCGTDGVKKEKIMHPITSSDSYLTLHFKTRPQGGARGRFELYLYEFSDDETHCYGQFGCGNDVVQCVSWNTTCNKERNCPDGSDEMMQGFSRCATDAAVRVRPTPKSTTTTTTTTTMPPKPSTSSVPTVRLGNSPSGGTSIRGQNGSTRGQQSLGRDRNVRTISSAATAGVVGASVVAIFFTAGCLSYCMKKRAQGRKQRGVISVEPSQSAAARMAQNPLLHTAVNVNDGKRYEFPREALAPLAAPEPTTSMHSSHYLPRPQPVYPSHSYHNGNGSTFTGVSRSSRRSHPECVFYPPSTTTNSIGTHRSSRHRQALVPFPSPPPLQQCDRVWSPPPLSEEEWSSPASGFSSRSRPMHTRPIPECPPPPPSVRSFSSCSYVSTKRNPTPVNM